MRRRMLHQALLVWALALTPASTQGEVVLSGQVTDPHGNPVALGAVTAFDPFLSAWPPEAMSPSQATILPEVEVFEDTSLDIPMNPVVTLTGQITDPAGQPLAGVRLYAKPPGGVHPEHSFTSEDGAYAFEGDGPQYAYIGAYEPRTGYFSSSISIREMGGAYNLVLPAGTYDLTIAPCPHCSGSQFRPRRIEGVVVKGHTLRDIAVDLSIDTAVEDEAQSLLLPPHLGSSFSRHR